MIYLAALVFVLLVYAFQAWIMTYITGEEYRGVVGELKETYRTIMDDWKFLLKMFGFIVISCFFMFFVG